MNHHIQPFYLETGRVSLNCPRGLNSVIRLPPAVQAGIFSLPDQSSGTQVRNQKHYTMTHKDHRRLRQNVAGKGSSGPSCHQYQHLPRLNQLKHVTWWERCQGGSRPLMTLLCPDSFPLLGKRKPYSPWNPASESPMHTSGPVNTVNLLHLINIRNTSKRGINTIHNSLNASSEAENSGVNKIFRYFNKKALKEQLLVFTSKNEWIIVRQLIPTTQMKRGPTTTRSPRSPTGIYLKIVLKLSNSYYSPW